MFFSAKPGATIPKKRKIHWCLRRNSRSNRHSFAVVQLPQLAQRSFKRGTSARIRSAGFNLDNLGVLPFLGNLMKPPNSYWMGKMIDNHLEYEVPNFQTLDWSLFSWCISRLNKSKYPKVQRCSDGHFPFWDTEGPSILGGTEFSHGSFRWTLSRRMAALCGSAPGKE